MVYSVEKFHCYIAGTKFVVVTDHAALVYLQEAKNRNPKLARWAMKLSCYVFSIKHRAGRIHNNADGLSRSRTSTTPDTPPPDTTGLEELTWGDTDRLVAALEAFEADCDIDGFGQFALVGDLDVAAPTLGPR